MKVITERKPNSGLNAWGRPSSCYRQVMVIEESDIGKDLPHYLGYNHRTYKVKSEDLGKVLEYLTDDSQWQCWSFGRSS